MSQSLFNKYRPKNWADYIGHQHMRKSISLYHKRGTLGGRTFMLSGPSGIGKSTAAYLIASDVCDEDNIEEHDATTITPKDIEILEKKQGQMLLGSKPGRVYIFNEVHGFRQDTIKTLLTTLERIHSRAVWIFTTTDTGKEKLFKEIDAHPLLSRCVNFELKVEDYGSDMIKRVMEIATIEELGGATHEEFVKLAADCKFNMRAMLTEVEKGTMMREVVMVRGNPRKPQVVRPGIDWDAVEMVSA